METRIQGGYYIWEAAGSPVTVHLQVEVVDRMLNEVMRGFGAVRKRGVEVGGLLIGTITEILPGLETASTVVRIEDFEPVPCEYRRGPSYLLSEEDGAAFENAYQRWRPSVTAEQYAVGYFRSHTRDGMALAAEDIELMEDYFPELSHVALLIKPAGTKVSIAGFFLRESNNMFPATTPLEFPFRRRELTGEDAPPHRTLNDRRRISFENVTSMVPASNESAIEKPPEFTYDLSGTAPGKSIRSSWIWMPVSIVFLMLGLMLGFQVGLNLGGRGSSNAPAQDYSLALSVSKNGENLLVRWNPDAPLVRAADRGELEIEDRGLTKAVPLDRANLQNGSITVQRASSSVHFRLTVYPRGRVAATESVDWRQ
jgi:hypothetical protein